MEAAPWWNSKNAQSGNPVVRHAPDDYNYHFPDRNMLDKMRGSSVGAFAVIPKARDDGLSYAFDGTKPGVVHVDPDAPDGGAIVDLEHLDVNAMDQALRTSYYPHEVFYKLGSAPSLTRINMNAQQPTAPRENPVLPGSYVVPQAAQDGTQMPPVIAQAAPIQPIVQEGHPLQPAPQQAPILQSQTPAPQVQQPAPMYYPPPVDPNLYATLHQISAGLQMLGQRISAVESRPAPPSQVPRLQTLPPGAVEQRDYDPQQPIPRQSGPVDKQVFADEAAPMPRRRMVPEMPQHLSQIANDAPRDGIIVGFESLRLDYVNGPLPQKAKRIVFFDLPEAGKIKAFYHSVNEGERSVVLVYDTRYEEGQQYLPPDMGEREFKLHVPHLKKTYTVSSMGFAWQEGVFDHVLLVKAAAEPLEYTDK
jgi:hypothetical protein